MHADLKQFSKAKKVVIDYLLSHNNNGVSSTVLHAKYPEYTRMQFSTALTDMHNRGFLIREDVFNETSRRTRAHYSLVTKYAPKHEVKEADTVGRKTSAPKPKPKPKPKVDTPKFSDVTVKGAVPTPVAEVHYYPSANSEVVTNLLLIMRNSFDKGLTLQEEKTLRRCVRTLLDGNSLEFLISQGSPLTIEAKANINKAIEWYAYKTSPVAEPTYKLFTGTSEVDHMISQGKTRTEIERTILESDTTHAHKKRLIKHAHSVMGTPPVAETVKPSELSENESREEYDRIMTKESYIKAVKEEYEATRNSLIPKQKRDEQEVIAKRSSRMSVSEPPLTPLNLPKRMPLTNDYRTGHKDGFDAGFNKAMELMSAGIIDVARHSGQ